MYNDTQFLLALALVDNAFFDINSLEKLWSLKISLDDDHLKLLWKKKIQNLLILRNATRTQDVIQKSMLFDQFDRIVKKIMSLTNFYESFTIHVIRCNLNKKVDDMLSQYAHDVLDWYNLFHKELYLYSTILALDSIQYLNLWWKIYRQHLICERAFDFFQYFSLAWLRRTLSILRINTWARSSLAILDSTRDDNEVALEFACSRKSTLSSWRAKESTLHYLRCSQESKESSSSSSIATIKDLSIWMNWETTTMKNFDLR